MNNPNPFVPKGSLLEQQDKRRKHMKIGVLCVLSVSVAGLMVMLIQGCKQKTDVPAPDTSMPTVDTNIQAAAETNLPTTDLSNQPPTATQPTNAGGLAVNTQTPSPIPTTPQPPQQPPQQITPLPPTTPEAGAGEYTVVKGDSLAKIAKKSGVSLKALEAANPDVKPAKLKINQKLVIPTGGKAITETPAAPGVEATASASESYTVKSGDTLTKIAKAHHVKLKTLQAANGLTTTKIKVGEKLKIPARAEAPVAAAPETAPVPPTADINTTAPPVPQPVPTTPPAPTSPAPGQH
jgi:LysM repeat protein